MFGHIEHQNSSIIDAMDYSSKIRKNVINGEPRTKKRGEMKKPITEAPLIAVPMEHLVEQAN